MPDWCRCLRKCEKNRGVSAHFSRGSRSPRSVLVALWGNGDASSVLKCHETGAIFHAYGLVGNLHTRETSEFHTRGLSDLREARHGKTYRAYPIGPLPKRGADALLKAKRQDKVRFLVFTGRKDPKIHFKMLAHDFPFDACQLPLNVFDGPIGVLSRRCCRSSRNGTSPPLAMKSISGNASRSSKASSPWKKPCAMC